MIHSRLWKSVALTALLTGAVMLNVAEAALVPVSTDLWDVSQGSLVTSFSGTLGGFPIGNTFNGDGFYTLFSDGLPTGTVHWVEWQTPGPVTLRSFNLLAAHDQPPRDARYRGFSEFSLYAYNTGTTSWDEIYEIYPSDPYSTTPPPPETYIDPQTTEVQRLYLSANVLPYTTDRFRAEFVQYGDIDRSASGPRIFELDGFDTFSQFVERQEPVIPEPATLSLALLGLVASRLRRRPA